ncbi:MAG: hypothetical protein V1835_05255 [Candidatus Micrarchaeota archaeon]
MDDLTSRIWEMEGGKRKTWWWWFWLFFIDNPKNPNEPLQLMILWSRKREKHILCNDVLLDMENDIARGKDKIEFGGATASWFFDGLRMHEDFLVKPSKITLYNDGKKGLVEEKSKFTQNGKIFGIWIKGKQAEIEFEAEMLHDFPSVKRSHGFVALQYDILKINRLKLKGRMTRNGKSVKIKGSAYFQKVFVSGPVVPWQWSMVHFGNGSYFSSNLGRLGHSLFAEHHSPLDLKIRGKAEFYDADNGRTYQFRGITVRRSPGRLPVFLVHAKNKEAELKIELPSYARALWRLQKSRLHKINTLYYHEFPVSVKHFSLKTASKVITEKELGRGVGNFEDSKGMMI